jgi:plastocyanin
MTRKRNTILAGVAILAAAGLGAGVAAAAADSPGQPAAAASPAAPAAASPAAYSAPAYSWYRSMMSGYYGGGMMGGPGDGWMMSPAGYQWMTGGTGAPGPWVSPAQARRLGNQAPAGASINRAARTITFTTMNVNLAVLASPPIPAESFRIAGMTNPAISVPAGAHVTIELVNAAGMHAATVTFTAAAPGSYQHLCPIPGHAREGMAGTFTVR